MSNTKWEYQFVTFKHPNSGETFRVNEINGQVDENKFYLRETPTMSDYSNTLGEQGWDLVFYEPHSSWSSIQAVFKRPKEDGL